MTGYTITGSALSATTLGPGAPRFSDGSASLMSRPPRAEIIEYGLDHAILQCGKNRARGSIYPVPSFSRDAAWGGAVTCSITGWDEAMTDAEIFACDVALVHHVHERMGEVV